MRYVFGEHSLDLARRELHRGAEAIAVEPQVFDLLAFLIRNRDRVISKDDLIASVWCGRIVSDSTLTSRINAARKAIGDSGAEQRLIRTLPRKGIRFLAPVREEAVVAPSLDRQEPDGSDSSHRPPATGVASEPKPKDIVPTMATRASIAVLPFDDEGASDVRGSLGHALVHDVITRLAKLRTFLVIAQGTVFALQERGLSSQDAAQRLNVDYVARGSVNRHGNRLTVSVELTDARSSRIVWADTYNRSIDDAFLILEEIGDSIVSSVASEIEALERSRAILKPPNSLDAWSAHHRGLWHMYRFNKADNDQARHFFAKALQIDPTFSRAYAGLSFTHWQNAFQGWADRKNEIELAYAAAGESLMADDRDPAGHWAMGRALWLRGLRDQSLSELAMSVDLSPNFAQAHYTLAFVHAQAGDPATAISSADHSHRLSPFDPMLFAIFASRAMALVRLGRFDEAADWAIKGASRPNAHAQIQAIAAYTLALAGRHDEGRAHLAQIRTHLPTYGIEDFLTAMRLEPDAAALFRRAASIID